MWSHLGPKEGLYCTGETDGLPLVPHLWGPVGTLPASRLRVAYPAVREAISLCNIIRKVYKGVSLPFP